MTARQLSSVGALLLSCIVAACSGDAPTAPAREALLVDGLAERGMAVQVALVDGTDTLPASALRLSVEPADAAAVLPDGSVQFRSEGTVTITATNARGGSARRTLEVKRPPRILFDMALDGNRDVYAVDLDGTRLQRLTTDPADDVEPTSASGRIVFTSYRGGNADLYAVASDGSSLQRLTATAANETSPVLSADGKHLAFVSDASGVQKTWLATADASGASPLGMTGDASVVERSPTWAPAGDRLAYASTIMGSTRIAVLTLGGTSSVLPAPGTSAIAVEPAWSPDGRWIAFAAATSGVTELYRISVPDGIVVQLTSLGGTVGEPAWLPDGRLLFTRFQNGESTLHWLDPARPAIIHDVPTGSGTAEHPAALR